MESKNKIISISYEEAKPNDSFIKGYFIYSYSNGTQEDSIVFDWNKVTGKIKSETKENPKVNNE